MTIRSLSMSFVLALGVTATGCATSEPVGGSDGSGSDSGSGSGSGAVPLTAEGKYTLQSDFDIATNIPGTVGTVVNGFIDATDSPDDPSRYVLDKLIALLPNGTFKNVVSGAEAFAAGYLNDRLLDVAPDFVVKILDIGDKFGQVAKHFGTIETLDVNAQGVATHTVVGLHFKVDTLELDYMLRDYGLQEVAVPNVMVTVDHTGKLTVANHSVGLSYGAVLRLAMDQVIIPMVDPTATNLSDVLHNAVDCTAVGQYVYEAIGIGSPSTFESACNGGLNAAASAIYSQIDKIDASALQFGIAGTAKAIDTNHDGKMDTIQTGVWAGTLSYSGSPAPLAKATFNGKRM
ncbi:MAG: hypothetical protein JWO36_2028 [Myxococcales bacterium]|nr:hypothetical protein [Myxococcales bacterium]